MEFVIVTGMSGAGKSATLKFLEDLDFFCVDNLPPLLIPKFAEVCFQPGSDITKVALGIDIRGGRLFGDLFATLDSLPYEYKILFLDARDNVLLKRYKETRRRHPLAPGAISEGIQKEREILSDIRQRATFILDTSHTLSRELKVQINNIFLEQAHFENITITIISFGFKNGIPTDADMIYDVRFIPNPFYKDELRPLTGNDEPVQEYVLSHAVAVTFLEKLKDMLDFTIPYFIKEDKNQLVVAIGCTGGKHRSVTLANKLHEHMKANDHNVVINHRDVNNPK
ncbi:MAG: RNase adapter RapZ [Defluviitaleaceae bacterium]|nr:RNase adapter RapZ [Defluviitaleaceae bacterium]